MVDMLSLAATVQSGVFLANPSLVEYQLGTQPYATHG